MNLLELLKANKGTVSSALGKELGKKVLDGDVQLLQDAVKYVSYEVDNVKVKNIRAGAAKILEKVAEKKPELLASQLKLLLPAFKSKEPQTRWMLLQVFGYCAKLNPKDASSILHLSKEFLAEKAGVCLSGSVHLYLGRIGATSKQMANSVMPILDDAFKSATENEVDWIFEAYINILELIDKEFYPLIKSSAKLYIKANKKSTQKRVAKVLKKLEGLNTE